MKIIDECLNPYRIDTDSGNICYMVKDLEDKVIINKESGEESSKNNVYGYYSSIEGALLKIVNLKLNKGDNTVSLEDYLAEFKEAKSQVLNLLKHDS